MGGKKSIPTHETEKKRIPQTGGDRGWQEGEQNRLSMLSPAAARQLQKMSISVASGAETIWIRLLTVYCPDQSVPTRNQEAQAELVPSFLTRVADVQ